MGSISTLGGALIGAAIDRAYDGTMLPFALAGVLLGVVGYACYRWADATWDRSADRELGVQVALAHEATAVEPGRSG